MQPSGYSPYQGKSSRKKRLLNLPEWKMHSGLKKYLLILLAILLGLFLIVYLCLGQLRFFANHFLRLGFFHKDYLILMQNNYELRPTGGFVTGFGELSVTMGLPSGISFHNVYEIDTEEYITPPYPHEELLKNEWYEGYTFRDANWQADFPSATEKLLELYKQKFPDKDVDGIIVMNFSMIENLLDRLGSVKLGDQELTGDNLFKRLTDSVNDVDRHNVDALAERKDVLGELIGPLMSKAKWHPFKTKKVVVQALKDKDLFLWLKSEGLQKKLEKKEWANHLQVAEESDFLAVNIANLGSKKADRYVVKEVHHHVDLKGQVPEITTRVTLRFPGEKNVYADDYKGYLRLYIPEGAEAVSPADDVRVDTESGFKVMGVIIKVPAGEEKTYSFRYQLPRSLLNNDEYRLKLIRQSGDEKDYLITVESNEDSAMASENFEVRENKAQWRAVLNSDVELSLNILPDTTPPYPIEQVFENLKTINIYWNEAISDASGGDALNYEIIDLDEVNEETMDKIKVTYAEVINQKTTRLEVEGITKQDLERYQIKLKDIRDLSNNPIDPDPKLITVVQRVEEK